MCSYPVPPAGTVALLFTDMEGSTSLARTLGPSWPGVLARHHALVLEAIAAHGGWVDNMEGEGDALFATFADAGSAADAAIAAQRALRAEPWPGPALEVRVRMGLHVGAVERRSTRYVGLEIHRAARVRDAAHGGQLLLTAAARALVGDQIAVDDLGLHRLKDFPAPEHLFCAVIDGRGAADFPPLRTSGLRPTNLPPDRPILTGRDQDLLALAAALGDPARRLVTVTGRGGCGKTSLALAVGAESLDRFPGGVWWISLATESDPEQVLGRVATALHADLAGRMSLQDALAARLAGPEALLILDNLEHLLAASPAVGALLGRVPNLRVLATSQAPLGLVQERVYQLEPLDELAAVVLLTACAEAAHPGLTLTGDDESTLVRICRRLDCLPLAVELAAGRLTVLTPDELDSRLAESLDLLRTERRDSLERHKSLRATVEWTLGQLPPAPRELFTAMGVFARAASLADIERVVGRDGTIDALAALMDFALVRRVEVGDGVIRFQLPEAIRQFAVVELETSVRRDEYYQAHAARVLEVLHAARLVHFSSLDIWTAARHLDEDAPAAVAWARVRDPAMALELAALWSLSIVDRGHGRDAKPFIGLVRDAVKIPDRVLAWVLVAEARLQTLFGELNLAVALYSESLPLIERTDPDLLPLTLSYRGKCRGFLGDFEGAIADCVRGTELGGPLGPLARASGLMDEVQVRAQAGQGGQCGALVEEAAELIGSSPPSMAGKDLENLRGDAALAAGRLADAIGHYVRSLTAATATSDDLQTFYDMCNISLALLIHGDLEDAFVVLGLAEATAAQLFGTKAFTEHVIGLARMEEARDRLGRPIADAASARGAVVAPGERGAVACEIASRAVSGHGRMLRPGAMRANEPHSRQAGANGRADP